MKLLITGDWQLDAAPAHDQVDPTTNRSTRFAETVDTIREVIEAGARMGAEGLLHLGDLTETKNPRAIESEAAADLFTLAITRGMRVWAVAGNHDGSLFEVSSSSFAPLAKMASIKPGAFKVFHKVEVDAELGMLAIPYQHRATPEQVRVAVQAATVGAKAPTFAAIHYGVVGCAVGAKNLVLPLQDYLSTETFKGVPVADIFAGHIHKGQAFELDGRKVWFPGSPVVCDMGEREDAKTWILFDTVTREVTVTPIPQRRRWLTVPYYPEIADASWGAGDEAPWGMADIVKVKGTYTKPDYPKDTLEKAFKNGLVRPFSLEIDVTQAKKEKAARFDLGTEGGLRDKLQGFVREKYHRESDKVGIYQPATALALEVLREQGAETFHPMVDPEEIEVREFLTIKHYKGDFRQGTPTLITGRNGIGKTNWMDAPLWCLVGKTSKALNLAGVVRQGSAEASVTMYLLGHGGENAETRYRIMRSVKLSKTGKPTQKLSLEKMGLVEWEAIGDGGIDETQAKINALIGGGYTSLRATAFKFQNDTNPVVRAVPADRKEVIGEVLGLEPIKKAFKVLDERRKESARTLEAAKDRLAGMVVAGEGQAERLTAATEALELARGEVATQEAALPAAETAREAADKMLANQAGLVTAQRGALEALPNTAAGLAAAEQALATFTQTYTESRAAKVTRFKALQAAIVQTEADLKALKASDPTATEALAKRVDLLALELADLTTRHGQAVTASTVAKAALEGARKGLDAVLGDLATAKASLDALPAPDGRDLGSALIEAEAEAVLADKAVSAAAALTVGLAGKLDQIKADLAKLATERKAFDGQDVGKCSRCGHELDDKHVEQELARIDTEVRDLTLHQAETTKQHADSQKVLGSAALRKTTAAAAVKTLTEAKQAQALAAQSLNALGARVAELVAKETAAYDAAGLAAEASMKADAAVKELEPSLVVIRTEHYQADLELRAMREIGTKLGTLTGQLQAQRQNLETVTAEGTKETESATVKTAELAAAVETAKTAHAINEATAGALRDELVKLETAQATAQAALVLALTAVNTVNTALTAGKQRVADLESQIAAIHGQQKALESAAFELATLKERADIDAAAASLLDPKQGLPVHLIDQALPFLEERINLYMTDLGMDRLTVELTTQEEDKETLAVLVDNGRPGLRLDIAAFSGGQLDRVEYALKCALADLQRQTRGVTLGLVCYDEPTGGLDEAGKEGLIRLLYDRCATYPVSLVVSHDEALIRSFDHRLQFSQGTEEETLVSAA